MRTLRQIVLSGSVILSALHHNPLWPNERLQRSKRHGAGELPLVKPVERVYD